MHGQQNIKIWTMVVIPITVTMTSRTWLLCMWGARPSETFKLCKEISNPKHVVRHCTLWVLLTGPLEIAERGPAQRWISSLKAIFVTCLKGPKWVGIPVRHFPPQKKHFFPLKIVPQNQPAFFTGFVTLSTVL